MDKLALTIKQEFALPKKELSCVRWRSSLILEL